MSDPRMQRLLVERIETVMELSLLMAEELRLMQAVGGAEVERLGGLETGAGAACEQALADCQDRLARLNGTLERIDIALSAPELK